jgi:ABC-type Fe3+ transport system permease subunit
MDGPWAAVFSLGLSGLPFPALFAARALERQSSSTQETALLIGGPKLAFRAWLRCALPATIFGAALAFLLAATDFAVPDYFAAVGDKFSVYAAEVFNGWRSENLLAGASTAAPLVLLAAIGFYIALVIRDRNRHEDAGSGKVATPIQPDQFKLPLSLLLWSILGLALILPLARILWETGAAGPEASGDWFSRSSEAFHNAFERGRADLLRSLRTGLLAGGLTLVVAPFWAHFFLNRKPGRRTRLLQLAIALPLLVPAVGTGLGSILVWNRPLTADFFDSWLLPPLILAGRFLPLAVFLLIERMERVPRSQDDAAQLAGVLYPARIFRYLLGPQRAAWLLSGALVAVFAIRELDLAVLLPAANPSAAVRYYNALHFARDGFVAAFGLIIALLLFFPIVLHFLQQSLKSSKTLD